MSQAYSLMQNNIKKFEHKERSFERMPPKRHSSYEDRLKGSSVSKRNDPRLFVTQRNWNSTHKQSYEKGNVYANNEYSISHTTPLDNISEVIAVRGNNNNSVQESMKRANTGIGGNRHIQPRQNPLMSHSPRTIHKIHLTPSEKKSSSKDPSYLLKGVDPAATALAREFQNQTAGNSFEAEQKAKRNRSSEVIAGYYKINRAKMSKKQYGIP